MPHSWKPENHISTIIHGRDADPWLQTKIFAALNICTLGCKTWCGEYLL